MGTFINLLGKRFSRLKVVSRAESGMNTYGRPITRWLCQCDCGNTSVVPTSRLTGGKTSSCGCFHYERLAASNMTHGLRKTRAYSAWSKMKDRCFNERSKKFYLWGGRGITVCDEWKSDFAAFFSHMGECPPGMSIDRIDNQRGYEPGNVRWATPLQQSNNLRTTKKLSIGSDTRTITEWAKEFGCSRDALKLRLRRGQTIEQIANAFGHCAAPRVRWVAHIAPFVSKHAGE